MVLGKLDFTYRRLKLDFTHRRLKLDPSFSSFLSLNSKWIKHLNIRCEIVKLLQEKIRKTLNHTDIG
jgi:hypothetical protein